MQSESKLTHCAHHHQTYNNIYTNLDIDMNLTKPKPVLSHVPRVFTVQRDRASGSSVRFI